VWSLISGVGIFFLGCGVSTYHGIQGLFNPHHIEVHTATHCNTLQHTTKRTFFFLGAVFQHIMAFRASSTRTASRYTLQHTATHCNTLQNEYFFSWVRCFNISWNSGPLQSAPHRGTHCNTLQHTATHCNTLQHTHFLS